MSSLQRLTFGGILFLFLLSWLFTGYKAIRLPITHDELATIIHYSNFSVWEIMMFPDPWPNNHILHTILAKFSMALLGKDPWAVRLPSWLFWAVYAYGAWRAGRWLFRNDAPLSLAVFFLLIANPFLLDFFSLARGYGMANALMLNAALFILPHRAADWDRSAALGWSLATLAAYANFTLLLFWVAANIWIGLRQLDRYLPERAWKPLLSSLGIQLVLAAAFGALIYTPINKMQSTNQFVYWESTGFFENTVVSLVEASRYGSKMIDIADSWWASGSVLLIFGSICLLFWLAGRRGWTYVKARPLFSSLCLLLLTIAVNLLQSALLETPYLTGRTALSYYPLFMLVGLAALREWWYYNQRYARMATAILAGLLLLHLVRTVNLRSVREWWYDQHTYAVIDRLNDLRSDNQAVALQTGWFFQPSFRYHCIEQENDWISLSNYREGTPDTLNGAQFFYGFESDVPQLEHPYDTVRIYRGGMILLERTDLSTYPE